MISMTIALSSLKRLQDEKGKTLLSLRPRRYVSDDKLLRTLAGSVIFSISEKVKRTTDADGLTEGVLYRFETSSHYTSPNCTADR